MSIIAGIRKANFERSSSVSQRIRSGSRYGQHISALTVDGNELQAGVFNENQVRAAAGLTMVIGAVAFSYAYFTHLYIPLQAVASFFFVEFLIRVTAGIQYSPTGVVAHAITRRNPPQWVSAKPKRFAWTLALGLGLAMTIITNSGIRGYLPRTICLICLTLMWMETALGLCLGCEIHGLLVRELGDTRSRVRGMCERRLRCSPADIASREAGRRYGTDRRLATRSGNAPVSRLRHSKPTAYRCLAPPRATKPRLRRSWRIAPRQLGSHDVTLLSKPVNRRLT